MAGVLRKRRKRFTDSFPDHGFHKGVENEKYISEAFSKIYYVPYLVQNMEGKIMTFIGTSKEEKNYMDLKHGLYGIVADLEKIEERGNEDLRRRKREAVLIVQETIMKLDKRLEENQSRLNAFRSILQRASANASSSKSRETQNTPTKLEVPVQASDADEGCDSNLADTKINKIVNSIHKVEQQFQALHKSHVANCQTCCNCKQIIDKYRLNSVNGNDSTMNHNTLNIAMVDQVVQKNQFYFNLIEKKIKEESIYTWTFIRDGVRALFAKLELWRNAVTEMFNCYPETEAGNRLALRKIQLLLMHMRLLMVAIIIEMPVLVSVAFLTAWLYK